MAHGSLPRRTATRYVVPLREGGTLPAVVEVEDGSLWVVKFRGAGQGARALIAEILVGELAREAGLPVPELAVILVPEALGRFERDPEIQDLLKASRGVNVGIRYLEGAFNFEPRAAGDLISPDLAARIVWFDAWVTNPDRTPRNPNLMIHDGRPWLIDHGAALYGHFNWQRVDAARTRAPFPHLERHVLLGRASGLDEADRELATRLDEDAVTRAIGRIPDELLADPLLAGEFDSGQAHRARYRDFLLERLQAPRTFARAAETLRRAHRDRRPTPMEARR